MITSAFTCTGPYAILILLGIKRVENRNAMPVPAKGRCAISCSKSFCKEEYGEFVRWASRALTPEEFETIPAWDDVRDWPGKVVGACDYEAGTARPESAPYQGVLLSAPVAEGRDGTVGSGVSAPATRDASGTVMWDEGCPYWWKLSEIVAFGRPIPCRGNVGMWQMPSALAAQVSAADRLARSVGDRIASAADAADLFRLAVPVADGSEGFFVIPLDENRRVLAEPILVSLGTSSVTTAVQPGEVFGAALKADAKAIVIAHNHPSGNTTPSAQDRELTAALKRLGEALGVTVLDHLVIGGNSFAVI